MPREAMYEDVPHVGRTYDSSSSWDGTYLRSQPTGFRVTEPTAGEQSGERPRSLMDLDYEAVSQRKSLSDEQPAVITYLRCHLNVNDIRMIFNYLDGSACEFMMLVALALLRRDFKDAR